MTALSNPAKSRSACDLRIRRNRHNWWQFGRDDVDRLESRANEGAARRRTSPAALQSRLHDRHGLRGELVERPVAMRARAEVGLGDDVGAEACRDVDEQRDVDAVALDERELLEQLAPAG